ncbi:MAG: hypothetical protein H7Z72_08675 [Bacteroidetes bacterium]|nr:hypothetical protein [Fibrella sp.]
MKASLRIVTLFLLIGSTFSACKQNESAEEIDLRTQYVGAYDPIQYNAVTYVGDFPSAPDQGRGALTVEKGTGGNKEFFINITFPGYSEQLVAELDGRNFRVINKSKEDLVVLGRSLPADYVATGEFTTDNQIIINLVVQTTNSGTLVKKVGSFTGPKK